MTSVGHGLKVVEEPALAAKQRVVLDTGSGRPTHGACSTPLVMPPMLASRWDGAQSSFRTS